MRKGGDSWIRWIGEYMARVAPGDVRGSDHVVHGEIVELVGAPICIRKMDVVALGRSPGSERGLCRAPHGAARAIGEWMAQACVTQFSIMRQFPVICNIL